MILILDKYLIIKIFLKNKLKMVVLRLFIYWVFYWVCIVLFLELFLKVLYFEKILLILVRKKNILEF